MTAKDKVDVAITKMVLSNPWWATLFLNLRRRTTREGEPIETKATDGTWLIIHEPFVDTMTVDETMGVLMHEVGHCALLHPMRRGTRNPMLWNIACDQCVNALLAADGIILPPIG